MGFWKTIEDLIACVLTLGFTLVVTIVVLVIGFCIPVAIALILLKVFGVI